MTEFSSSMDDDDFMAELRKMLEQETNTAMNTPIEPVVIPEPTVELPAESDAASTITSPAEEERDWEFESQLLLQQLNGDLATVEEEYNSFEGGMNKLKDERAALQKRMADIASELSRFENDRYEVRRKHNELRKQIQAAEQNIEVERQNKLQKEQQESLLSTFELRTVDMPWRTGKKVTLTNAQGFIEVPTAMKHQISGGTSIAAADGKFLLADGMGLGKTLTSLIAASMLDPGKKDKNGEHITGGTKPVLKILVVMPGEGMTDFVNSVRKWTYYKAVVIGRAPKVEQEAMFRAVENREGVVVIINYEAWAKNRAIIQWINKVHFDMVIGDEAHHMKNIKTSTYKGVNDIVFSQNKCTKCGSRITMEDDLTCPNKCQITKFSEWDGEPYTYPADLEPSIKHVLLMTGTPILNKPQEMFTCLHLISPRAFNDIGIYTRRFVDWTGKGWNAGGEARLAQQIVGFYLKRSDGDTDIVMPPQTEYIHELEILEDEYPLQFDLLNQLRRNAEIQIKKGEKDGKSYPMTNLMALITRQRQATVFPGGISVVGFKTDDAGDPVFDENGELIYERDYIGKSFNESIKIDRAVELWQELRENGHRVAVCSQFLTALKEFTERIQHPQFGAKVGRLHGGVSKAEKEDVKANFNLSNHQEARYDTVVFHYKTGGESVNLHAATAMIVLDEEWNEGKQGQAYNRIRRIGTTEKTQIHILRHVGPQKSIDTWLANLVEFKSGMIGQFNSQMAALRTAF